MGNIAEEEDHKAAVLQELIRLGCICKPIRMHIQEDAPHEYGVTLWHNVGCPMNLHPDTQFEAP